MKYTVEIYKSYNLGLEFLCMNGRKKSYLFFNYDYSEREDLFQLALFQPSSLQKVQCRTFFGPSLSYIRASIVSFVMWGSTSWIRGSDPAI